MHADARPQPDQGVDGPTRRTVVDRLTRTWASTAGRRVLVWGSIAFVVVVVLGIGIAVFSSISHESQAYKNGFSAGASVFTADGTGASPSQACRTAAARPPNFGGVPAGENAAQWIKGCVAEFESAQSDN